MNTYPQYAEINGKQYPINTDYRVALACFEAINDDEITDIERPIALIGLLFGENAEIQDTETAMKIIKQYLQCGKVDEENDTNVEDIDFEYDKDLITASFMSDYHIDLENTKMHWWKFCSLISGLKDDSILNKVRDVRNYDISDVKDTKTRNKILKQKQKVAIPVKHTKEEQKEIDEFESWLDGKE